MCIRRLTLHALAAAALVAVPVQAAQMPVVYKSVFWEPYPYDAQTTALFHFDGDQQLSIDEVLDADAPDDDAFALVDEPTAPPVAEDGQRTARNAVALAEDLLLIGACAETENVGRFGGGLRFDGKDGRVRGKLPGGARTIEFWLQPRVLPDDRATLVYVEGAEAPIAVCLDRNGALQVEWAGKKQTAPDVKLRPGNWTHLALAWDGREVAEMRIDGDAVAFPEGLPVAWTGGSTEYVAGNDPAGESGFDGVIDELRCSRIVRPYYPWLLRWADVDGALRRIEDQPYFRDAADLLFHIDFNRTLKPARATGDVAFPELAREELGDEIAPDRWKRHFGAGVEREGFFLGSGRLEARYEGTGFARPGSGTVAFWIRPLDWNTEVRWHRLAKWGMYHVPVFRLLQDAKAKLAVNLIRTPDESVRYPIGFQPGRWVCLLYTSPSPRDRS